MNKILPKILAFLSLCLLLLGGKTLPGSGQEEAAFRTYVPWIAAEKHPVWIGPDGGKVVAIAVDPTQPKTVYAGTWGAGVYKSTDSGATWQPANQGLGNLYINALAVSPKQPQRVYAGTFRDKLYKSEDGGQTWVFSSQGIQDEAIVYCIAVNPNDPAVIYIGTRGISNNGGPPWNGVLYKSSDGGNTWQPSLQDVGGNDQQDWVYDIDIRPDNPETLIAASHEHGLFRSQDGGKNWNLINDGIDDISTRTVAYDPQNPKTVYTGVWHGGGVYKSHDGGENWVQKNNSLTDVKIYTMAIDPLNSANIFLGTFTRGLVRSTNWAESWQDIGLGSMAIYSIAINPQDSQVLYIGTSENGLFKSADGGDGLVHSQAGLQNSSVSGLLSLPGGRRFASSYGGGVVQATGTDAPWMDASAGLGDLLVHSLVSDPSNPQRLFALAELTGLYVMDTSTGSGWQPFGSGLPAPTSRGVLFSAQHPFASLEEVDPWFSPQAQEDAENLLATQAPLLSMAFAPSEPARAYLGTGGAGVYASLDGGASWSPAGLSSNIVWSLAVDPMDALHLFAAADLPGRVETSLDGGAHWGYEPIPGGTIYSLAYTSGVTHTLYAATSAGLSRRGPDGIWVPAALEGINLTVISAHPSRPGWLFAGSASGAYYSTDNGLSWLAGPEQLSGLTIQSIGFDGTHPEIVYFGTTVRGTLQAYFP